MADIHISSCNAGVAISSVVQPTLVGGARERVRDELEGRTGETDSEEEDEDNEGGEEEDEEGGEKDNEREEEE